MSWFVSEIFNQVWLKKNLLNNSVSLHSDFQVERPEFDAAFRKGT